MIHFGQLILYLACGSQKAIHDLPRAIDHISKLYSADLKDIVLYLLSKPSQMKSIDHVIMAIAPRMLLEFSNSLLYVLLSCNVDFLFVNPFSTILLDKVIYWRMNWEEN